MKTITLQNTLVTAVLLATTSYVSLASAADPVTTTTVTDATNLIASQSVDKVTGTLGAARSAVDIYQVACSKNTAGATAQFITKVMADKGKPMVSVQAFKGKLATNSTDLVNGNTAYSDDAKIKSGDGIYTVLVDKSAEGAINYTVSMSCQTAKGTQSGQAKSVSLQNQ